MWRGTLFQNGQNQRLNWIILHLLTFEFSQKVDLVAEIELFKVWDCEISPKPLSKRDLTRLKGIVQIGAVKRPTFSQIDSNRIHIMYKA